MNTINMIKRIAFENVNESSIIFQFFYANIPAESPSYAPTFFLAMSWGVASLGAFIKSIVVLYGSYFLISKYRFSDIR